MDQAAAARRKLARGTRTVLLVACAALAAWAVVVQREPRTADGSYERVKRAGVLRVGYSVEPPYAMVRPDGVVSGESPETARRIAQRIGIGRVDMVQIPFDHLIDDLKARRIDVIATGMFVTPERAQRVRFSEPVWHVGAGLVVRGGNPAGLSGFDSLAQLPAGQHVAALAGTVEHDRLLQAGVPAALLLTVPDLQAGRAAVAGGAAVALAISLPSAHGMVAASQRGTLEALRLPPGSGLQAPDDLVAFAFHPDDAALQRQWNRTQRDYLGSPEHLAIVRPFGFAAEDLAAPPVPTRVSAR